MFKLEFASVDPFTRVGANICIHLIGILRSSRSITRSVTLSFPPFVFVFVPAGLCRSIGVSNFMIHHLEQLKQDCTVVPHVNQVSQKPSRGEKGVAFA